MLTHRHRNLERRRSQGGLLSLLPAIIGLLHAADLKHFQAQLAALVVPAYQISAISILALSVAALVLCLARATV